MKFEKRGVVFFLISCIGVSFIAKDLSLAAPVTTLARTEGPAILFTGVEFFPTDRLGFSWQFKTTILVKNTAPNKKVAVVYTTDNWATTRVANASYQSLFQGPYETWTTFESLSPPQGRLEFAAVVEANGASVWANNGGKNFHTEDVRPLCELSWVKAGPGNKIEAEISLVNLGLEQDVSGTWDLDYGPSAWAPANFAKRDSEGRLIYALQGEFANEPLSPVPFYHFRATCDFEGETFKPNAFGYFPGEYGKRALP